MKKTMKKTLTFINQNFVTNSLSGLASKLADQLMDPGLVLPWILDNLGAPVFMSGLLVPIRRTASLLPQLVVAHQMKPVKTRKWVWVTGSLVESLAVFLMALSVISLTNFWGGFAILMSLLLFSLARSLSSVSFKDVLAKTIKQGNRGKLYATRTFLGGSAGLVAGAYIRWQLQGTTDPSFFRDILLLSSFLWLVAAVFFALIKEPDQDIAVKQKNLLQDVMASIKIIRTEPVFRRFLLSRALFLTIPLSIPFYSLLVKDLTGGTLASFGLLFSMHSLAQVGSSPLWGLASDRSSRQSMLIGGGIYLLVVLAALLTLFNGWANDVWLSFLLLLLGFGYAGVKLARSTYLVDVMPSQNRPLYVAITNTVMGVVTILGVVLGIVAVAGQVVLFTTFALLVLGAMYHTWRLPEASTYTFSDDVH